MQRCDVYPKFICFKTLWNKSYKVKNRYFRRSLPDEMTKKNRSTRSLKKQIYGVKSTLHGSTTRLRRLWITYTLTNKANKESWKLKTSLGKKFGKITKDVKFYDGTI